MAVPLNGIWKDPGSGLRMRALRVEVAAKPGSGRLYRPDTHRRMTAYYDCGCLWELDYMTLRIEGPPKTCPNHDPASPQYASGGIVAPITAFSFAPGWPMTTSREPAPARELELSFETEPLVGWRTWKLVSFERHGGIKEMRLASLTGREVWEPKTRAEGRCLPNSGFHYGTVSAGRHEAPWPSCHCGIWATREREVCENEMRQARLSGARVVGEVSMWGRVLEFQRGWRARYAGNYPFTGEDLI